MGTLVCRDKLCQAQGAEPWLEAGWEVRWVGVSAQAVFRVGSTVWGPPSFPDGLASGQAVHPS